MLPLLRHGVAHVQIRGSELPPAKSVTQQASGGSQHLEVWIREARDAQQLPGAGIDVVGQESALPRAYDEPRLLLLLPGGGAGEHGVQLREAGGSRVLTPLLAHTTHPDHILERQKCQHPLDQLIRQTSPYRCSFFLFLLFFFFVLPFSCSTSLIVLTTFLVLHPNQLTPKVAPEFLSQSSSTDTKILLQN